MTRSAEPEPLRVDTRGLKCPWPVLRAARTMRDVCAILLLADDPVARVDVPALAAVHDWSISVDYLADHDAYLIRKG